MEKINVAELLKDCPSGMELDCTMYEGILFERVDENVDYPIAIRIGEKDVKHLTKEGCWNKYSNAKCVIFPKGKTTWEGFRRPYINGDIVYTIGGSIAILDDKIEEHSTSFNSYCGLFGYRFDCNVIVSPERLANEEEKARLFQAINDNGYKWNAETKTLEKLIQPKFKVGDIITNGDITSVIKQITEDSYILDIKDDEICFNYVFFKNQDRWELVSSIKPKFKIGDKVRVKNGVSEPRIIDGVFDTFYSLQMFGKIDFTEQDRWELVPNKFDINTLVPFESKVLVRDNELQKWFPAIWGFYDSDSQDYQYKLVGVIARYCIPYEGNEHLLGKTADCDEFYRTWEN